MKIAYILPISWGGIPHYTAELANAISKYEDVTVIKPADSNDSLFVRDVEVINVFKPLHFSRKNKIRSALSFKNIINFISFKNIKLINNIKPDIIHFPELYFHSNFFTFLYKLNKKYPIVHTSHAVFSVLERPINIISILNRLSKHLIQPEKIIVHTEECKRKLIKMKVNPKMVVVIPHGAYTLFTNFKKKREKNNTENDETYILFFGYIDDNKGLEYLIKAVPIVSKKLPNIKVIIAGEGNFSKYSRYIIDKSKFKIYNKFIPNEMVAQLFQQSKVVVLPYTYHQGHSGVLTVAFSFGKPVVVTNVGSLPELVKDGIEGFVVPPKDPKTLADAIIKILEDDKLRKKMSRNALKKAEELSWDNIAKTHIKVYEEVIAERK